MNFELTVNYIDCQKCGERVNCDVCESKLSKRLLSMGEFKEVELNIANKNIRGVASVSDIDDVYDALEEVGLFA